MKIFYNKTFKQFLNEFNLPEDLSFSVEIPKEVRKIIESEILITELGVSLSASSKLYEMREEGENQSNIEDFQNHFHVDLYIQPPDNKKVFMLGVKTLVLLAEKFINEKVGGIRFTYSLQTPELGLTWSKENNLYEEGDEHYMSDRLSFYMLREGEEVAPLNEIENKFWAKLIIDI